MRRIERHDEPACLLANAHAWNEDFAARRRDDPNARFSWRSPHCYRHIRDALLRMTADHCAFCDGPLKVESRATVEHFRPKSAFAQFAFTWTNLFPCCDMCQSEKRESFDERLLKPDEDGYSFGRYFVANYRTGDIEALPSAPAEEQARAIETIRMYGLNSPERRKARKREWEFYLREREEPESDVLIDDYHYRFFLEG